ncbi:ATP-binding cassette domain-containing protein [Rhizobium lusitanum]|uniref:ATP-binding cassette domain-containing protein n=1 Tax=Rhizobium lusitanum TaxID=293958 RepID=A0A6L9UKG6_9HYPH|nr:ABC transporter ATP-binding protein [Rhizobium lusitanum]NEI74842.1 ATP-binding cassette domain-containing protein [Rhizobium lusitanum]
MTIRSLAGIGKEPPLLKLENLSLNDDNGRSIVTSVSLNVAAGQTIGIVGESGSGKSMLCKSILGILPGGVSITSGSIHFNGTDLSRLSFSAWRQIRGPRIAAIFQDPASYLNPSIPVGRQVAEVFFAHRRASRKASRLNALKLLEAVSLRDPELVYNRYSFELSGGMLQRIAIAAAVAIEPELLIADEATTALDVTVQADILDLLFQLRTTLNLAVIFVSHDLAVIAQVSDHIIVMRNGQIVEQGHPERVLLQPEHPYTRGLVDSHHRFGIEQFVRQRRVNA